MHRKSGISQLFKILLFVLLLLSISAVVTSQDLIKPVNQNETNFIVRIKQFNEFIDRFNYRTNLKGEPADSLFKSKISRSTYITSLFDQKDIRTISSGKSYSVSYISLRNEFINDVTTNNHFIQKYSANIIAEAKSKFLFNGKQITLSLFLTQEIVSNNRVKWVINTVKGDLFNFLKSDTSMIRFIPPSSNETDFMNLKRALDDKDYLQYYASQEYEPDNLTLFFFLINSSVLKIEYTEEVIYHIIDIPGWDITVREFNRNEMNSGWLISDVSKNSFTKSSYLKKLK